MGYRFKLFLDAAYKCIKYTIPVYWPSTRTRNFSKQPFSVLDSAHQGRVKKIKIENNIELILKLFIDWTELPIRSNAKAEGILFAIIILRSADLCTNLLKVSILEGGAKNQGNYISFLSVIKVFYGASKILLIGLSTGNNTVKKPTEQRVDSVSGHLSSFYT